MENTITLPNCIDPIKIDPNYAYVVFISSVDEHICSRYDPKNQEAVFHVHDFIDKFCDRLFTNDAGVLFVQEKSERFFAQRGLLLP